MDDNLKLILLAIVVMFFISRLMDNANAYPNYTTNKNTTATSKSQTLQSSSKIITTQILDAQGKVLQSRDSQY